MVAMCWKAIAFADECHGGWIYIGTRARDVLREAECCDYEFWDRGPFDELRDRPSTLRQAQGPPFDELGDRGPFDRLRDRRLRGRP